jgi:hypothetical protein
MKKNYKYSSARLLRKCIMYTILFISDWSAALNSKHSVYKVYMLIFKNI